MKKRWSVESIKEGYRAELKRNIEREKEKEK